MRLYSFVNYYLSPLQYGLQTAHLVSELSTNSCDDFVEGAYTLWARQYKTIVILNGGNNESLQNIHFELCRLGSGLSLPVAKFHEDEQSLGGVMTTTGIIVPEHIYEHGASEAFSPDMSPEELITLGISPTEHELATLLRSFPLAR